MSLLRSWARWLPYWVIEKYVKDISSSFIQTKELGSCKAVRMADGVFILWSEKNWKAMQETHRKNREFEKLVEHQEKRKQYEKLKEEFEHE